MSEFGISLVHFKHEFRAILDVDRALTLNFNLEGFVGAPFAHDGTQDVVSMITQFRYMEHFGIDIA